MNIIPAQQQQIWISNVQIIEQVFAVIIS